MVQIHNPQIQFSEEQLQYNGFQSKQDLIDYVSTPGEHFGMEII